MKITVSSSSLQEIKADLLVYFMFEDEDKFAQSKQELTSSFSGLDNLFASGDFTGKNGSSTSAYVSGGKSTRLTLYGIGKSNKLTAEILRKAASAAFRSVGKRPISSLAFVLPKDSDLASSDIAYATAEGAILGAYKFDKYLAKPEGEKSTEVSSLTLVCAEKSEVSDAKKSVARAEAVCQGVYLSRDLGNEPNNVIYPETLAKRAQEAGKDAGFKVTVFDKKKITSLKMNGLLAVNQGSTRPPQFIVMEYSGGKKGEAPIALVGKGITFDTGGISIKPGAGMSEMKFDMHGAATVIGAMYAIAKLKLPVNVVAFVPTTENMPSGSAYVPGDIITYSNGVTVEIDNTDAEGRLILADALIYAQTYKPKVIIDFATLTGACVIALGSVTTGMMGTCEETKSLLAQAAKVTNEYVCELPLYEEYEEQIKSPYADLKNSGGREAGSITAGLFLKKFVGNTPWVHMDIAGTAMPSKPIAYATKGASGVGVRLLVEMLS